jgi:uncharacterized protein YjdB
MRRIRPFVIPALSLAASVVLGCYQDDPGGPAAPNTNGGRTRVLITDAPFPYDSVARVEVYVTAVKAFASADTGRGAPGVTVATPRRRVDLLAYQQGNVLPIGEGALPAGQYAAVSLTLNVDSSRVIDQNGRDLPVHWGSAGEITIHALVEHLLDVPASGAEIVVDFDVGRSFRSDSAGGFDFVPWIRAVNRSATGTITGAVSAGGDDVAGVPIGVYRAGQAPADTVSWQIAATGRTDAAGRYTVAFLNPGEYVVRVEPPPGSPLAGQSRRVTVTAGATVPGQSFALSAREASMIEVSPPPDYLLVGQTIALGATPFGSAGDPLLDAPVSWSSSDPAVATVVGADRSPRNVGTVTGVGPGVVRVTASYQGRSAYVDVVVRSTPVSEEDRVAGVRISATNLNLPSPSSFVAPTGATLFLSAVAVDSLGAPLDMHPVTWSSSDPATLELHATTTIDNRPGLRYLGGFRALAPGTATVTASAAGHTASAAVLVSPASIVRIELSPIALTVNRGEIAFFSAAPIDVTGFELHDSVVAWESSDETIAAIRSVDGRQASVAALRAGTVRIRASSDGKTATATLTVK